MDALRGVSFSWRCDELSPRSRKKNWRGVIQSFGSMDGEFTNGGLFSARGNSLDHPQQGKIPESANWNSVGSYMVARGKSALSADDLVGRYSFDFIEKSLVRGLDLNQRLQERPAKQGWTPPSAAAVRWPSSGGSPIAV